MDKQSLAEMLGVEVDTISDDKFSTFLEQQNTELDRARTQASRTAAKNAKTQAEQDAQKKVEEAAQARARELLQDMMLTEQEKLEAQMEKDREAFMKERAEFEQTKRATAVEAKLKAAGYDDKSLETLVPLFAAKESVEDSVSSVETFLGEVNALINERVDTIKADLTNGGVTSMVNKTSGAAASIKTEQSVLAGVYDTAKDADFVNTPRNNLDLDVLAIQQLEGLSEQ